MSFRRSATEVVRDAVLDAVEVMGSGALPAIEARLANGSSDQRAITWSAAQAAGHRSSIVEQALRDEILRNDLTHPERRWLLALAISSEFVGLDQFAIESLAVADDSIQVHASTYLAKLGEPDVAQHLVQLYQQHASSIGTSAGSVWACKRAISGLDRLGAWEDQPLLGIGQDLESSLQGLGPLEMVDAVLLVRGLPCWPGYPFLLDALSKALPRDELRNVVFHALNTLDEVDDLAVLRFVHDRAQQLRREGTDLGAQLAQAVMARPPEVSESLTDHSARQAIRLIGLLALPTAAEELGKLLLGLDWPTDQAVADQLLVLGDQQIDSVLATKLKQWRDTSTGKLMDEAPLYASSTSAGTLTSAWLVNFLASSKDNQIQVDFPGRVLVPLLQTGVLATNQLHDIATNRAGSVSGRIAALHALAIHDAKSHIETFRACTDDAAGQAFDRYLIEALGGSEDSSVATIVVDLASRYPDDDWIQAVAVESLAEVRSTGHADWVRQQFERFPDSHNIAAFASAWMTLQPEAVDHVLKFVSERVRDYPFTQSYYVGRVIDRLCDHWQVAAVRDFVKSLVGPLDPDRRWLPEYQGDAFRSLVQTSPVEATHHAILLAEQGMLTDHSQQVLMSNFGKLIASSASIATLAQLSSTLLDTTNRQLAMLLAEGAESGDSARALEVFQQVSEDFRVPVRTGVTRPLAVIGGEELLDALTQDPSWWVRRAARSSLQDAARRRTVERVAIEIEESGNLTALHWRVLAGQGSRHHLERLWHAKDRDPKLAPKLLELRDQIDDRRKSELADLRKNHGKYGPKGASPQVVSLG